MGAAGWIILGVVLGQIPWTIVYWAGRPQEPADPEPWDFGA